MRIVLLSDKYESPFTCSSCRKSIPSPFCAIEGVPAVLGCSPNPDIKQDQLLDFQIYLCPTCGMIQTDTYFNTTSYENVHSHGVGITWAEHNEKLYQFAAGILSERHQSVETVLEIGPSVQPLSKILFPNVLSIQYIDLMNEAPFELQPNETYKKFHFPSQGLKGRFHVIIASHVLEHSENLMNFIHKIADHLHDGGVAFLSTPNFKEWLLDRYWNAITPEHINYPFEEHLQDLCNRLNLNVTFARFKKHSTFVCITHRNQDSKHSMVSQSFSISSHTNTKNILEGWIRDINTSINSYEEVVSDSTAKVFLAGASHLSQYLYLMSPIIRKQSVAVIDNAMDKHGKRLYGTKLIAKPFDAIRGFKEVIVIVPPSPYIVEMTKQIALINPRAIVVS